MWQQGGPTDDGSQREEGGLTQPWIEIRTDQWTGDSQRSNNLGALCEGHLLRVHPNFVNFLWRLREDRC